MAAWVRRPDPSNGTVPSLSPWITSVGTVIFGRSLRKSVVPNAAVQPVLPVTGDVVVGVAGSAVAGAAPVVGHDTDLYPADRPTNE